ncbi:MAG: hypothetical protein US24_C0027G0009 [candidate division WS6 bacterium GW2011_GWC2_36_7]|uniref:Uncharacterized protein n=2 Tax=Candidatus Dojkabacteria TaxID=74243 RepID=A0A0G0FRC0_9BACT|nr:MAG: hypothetical protein US24_C0027G0009 [candidate division WS6 bacterium GW2011_GWC2_36_7]KKQ16405.1 MAG: hypothetical protein US29_C0026G0004 [candidate division WS6 bacterium GW2011_GWF1_36_8]HAM37632.1 hypothetical protein [Patescibacteria group bacterium]HAM96701.1 hypothetical protein [Patescibacteria group bacterium]
MEETILQSSVSPEVKSVEVKGKKKILPFIISGVVLFLLIVSTLVFFWWRKEQTLSLIDDSVNSLESMLDGTDAADSELSDLPDNFLDTEAVSTDEVNSTLSELDSQITALDGLDADFTLETSDVGLD